MFDSVMLSPLVVLDIMVLVLLVLLCDDDDMFSRWCIRGLRFPEYIRAPAITRLITTITITTIQHLAVTRL